MLKNPDESSIYPLCCLTTNILNGYTLSPIVLGHTHTHSLSHTHTHTHRHRRTHTHSECYSMDELLRLELYFKFRFHRLCYNKGLIPFSSLELLGLQLFFIFSLFNYISVCVCV